MKRLFLIVAMVTMIGTVGTVFATSAKLDMQTNSGTTEITYTSEGKYFITIPDAFSLKEKGTPVPATVSATEVFIPNNTKLQVKIEGANCKGEAWYIKDQIDEFEYKISKGEMKDENLLKTGDVILEVESGTITGGSTTLNFDLNETVVKAGTYKDTLTFTSSIVAK